MTKNTLTKITTVLLSALFITSTSTLVFAAESAISLDITVSTDTSTGYCGTDDTIAVDLGTEVNFCYVVTNIGATTLEKHILSSNVLDNSVSKDFPLTLVSGQTFQFNTTHTVSSTIALSATWSATQVNDNTSNHSANDSVLVGVNDPDINLPQASIDFLLYPDESDSDSLIIDNLGTSTLNWDLEENAFSSDKFSRLPAIKAIQHSETITHTGPPVGDSTQKFSTTPASVQFGNSSTAYAIRTFPDNPPQFTSFDVSSPSTVTDIGSLGLSLTFAGDFIGSDSSKLYILRNDTFQLSRISVTSASVVNIGAAPTTNVNEIFWSGLTWDPDTENLYATASDGTISQLYIINQQTGAPTLIGLIGFDNIVDVAADAFGRLYAVDADTDELIGIDKVTGIGTAIGPLNFNSDFAQGLDFDYSNNTLYYSSCANANNCGVLRTINLATGHSTSAGQIGGAVGDYVAFAIASELTDFPCQAEAIPWMSFGISSGTTAAAGTSLVSVSADSTGLAYGTYTGTICVLSDDPDEPVQYLPVSLTVHDVIFVDGFDD